ncbi:MAG: hypothetical protein ACI814_002459, partial [Mariniblastus sp.]
CNSPGKLRSTYVISNYKLFFDFIEPFRVTLQTTQSPGAA